MGKGPDLRLGLILGKDPDIVCTDFETFLPHRTSVNRLRKAH